MALSLDQIRALREWYANPNLACLPVASVTADTLVAALDELLAFREGYDSAERLPEDGQRCAVEYRWPGTDEINWAVDVGPHFGVPESWVIRWYPIGGER